jgi:hypothetical protein
MNQQTFTYKLRGECHDDYMACIAQFFGYGVIITDEHYEQQFLEIDDEVSIPIPDFEWTFTTTETKKRLIKIMKRAFVERHDELHVMWETINYANDYTGERIN